MKLIVMLVAIYALIINQSLKQKDRDTRLKADMGTEKTVINHTHSPFYNAVFGQEFISLPVQAPNRSQKNKNGSPALYKEQLLHPLKNSADNNLQDFLYPVKFSYTPANTAPERLR